MHRRRSDLEVGAVRRKVHLLPAHIRREAARAPALLAHAHRDLPSPLRAAHIACDDVRDERPLLPARRQHVEVVPLGPAVAMRDVLRRQMKVIDARVELVRRGCRPAAVAVVIAPGAREHRRQRVDRGAVRRDLSRRAHGALDAVRAEVQQLSVDLRRDRRDLAREPRRREQLAIDEARVGDREEQAAHAAGLHHLDVHPLGQHRHLPAANELLVTRLREHRLPDREQHDHHADAHRVAEQKKERAERTVSEIPQREERDHTRGSRQGGGLSGRGTAKRSAASSSPMMRFASSASPASCTRRAGSASSSAASSRVSVLT